MAMTEIAGAAVAFNAMKGILESMVSMGVSAAFQQKRLELQSLIIDAQNHVLATNEERSALLDKVSKLETEVAGLKNWDAEKERYKLTDVGSGVVAYVEKSSVTDGEVPHRLCANCFSQGQKSFLQPMHMMPGRALVLACHRCGGYGYAHGATLPEHAPVLSKLSRRI